MTTCKSINVDPDGSVLILWDDHNGEQFTSVQALRESFRGSSVPLERELLLRSVVAEIESTGRISEGERTYNGTTTTRAR